MSINKKNLLKNSKNIRSILKLFFTYQYFFSLYVFYSLFLGKTKIKQVFYVNANRDQHVFIVGKDAVDYVVKELNTSFEKLGCEFESKRVMSSTDEFFKYVL